MDLEGSPLTPICLSSVFSSLAQRGERRTFRLARLCNRVVGHRAFRRTLPTSEDLQVGIRIGEIWYEAGLER